MVDNLQAHLVADWKSMPVADAPFIILWPLALATQPSGAIRPPSMVDGCIARFTRITMNLISNPLLQ